MLDSTIEQAAMAITEGRDAVQGLRDPRRFERNDLGDGDQHARRRARERRKRDRPAGIQVAVEGETRDLHPIVRDEIYKIAAEALRNAFRHARAKRVEVEIRYDNEQFRLRIRDDGKGIDPSASRRPGPSKDTMGCAACGNAPH